MARPEPSDELVGKRHADETEMHWVEACEAARRGSDVRGAFCAFVCDLLEIRNSVIPDTVFRLQIVRSRLVPGEQNHRYAKVEGIPTGSNARRETRDIAWRRCSSWFATPAQLPARGCATLPGWRHHRRGLRSSGQHKFNQTTLTTSAIW